MNKPSIRSEKTPANQNAARRSVAVICSDVKPPTFIPL